MYEEIELIREKLDSIEKESILRDAEEYKSTKEADRYKTILLELLKSKIGHKIYWAHKNWRKYETHTIADVSVDIQENSFFGEEYKGKECIKIHIKNGGHFIADGIGKTLFFDESEAALHTYKD
jgi:hypothetical protein